MVSVIRIGPTKHRYLYTYMGSNTYKCGRGSDWSVAGEVLWMMKAPDGLWYAFDAQQDTVPTSIDHAKCVSCQLALMRIPQVGILGP